MNSLKNMFAGILVLAISYGIFVWLTDSKQGKEKIETYTRELVAAITPIIDSLVEKLPTAERDEVEKDRIEFINKVYANEVSMDQYNTLIARTANLQISPDTAKAEEIRSILTMSTQSPPDSSKAKQRSITEKKAKDLARRIQQVENFKNEIAKIENDSIRIAVSRRTMVAADSELHILVDDGIQQDQALMEHPDVRRFILNLPRKDMVKFEDFNESSKFIQLAVKNYASIIPPTLRETIFINAGSDTSIAISFDSIKVKMPSNIFDGDAWEKFGKDMEKAAETWAKELE